MSNESNARKYIIFCSGQKEFIVQIEDPLEIIKVTPFTKTPQGPLYFRGMIALRSRIVSVVDLGILLGDSETKILKETHIIVFGSKYQNNDAYIGFLVDSVTGTIELTTDDFSPAPVGRGDTQFVESTKVAKYGDGLLQLVDLTALADHLNSL